MRFSTKWLAGAAFLAAIAFTPLHAETAPKPSALEPLLAKAPETVTFDEALFAALRETEPAFDTAAFQKTLDTLAEEAGPQLAAVKDLRDKVRTLARFLHDEKGYRLHQGDPIAVLSQQTFETLCAKKRGGCVTLSLLMAAVGRRSGLALTPVQAPGHLFLACGEGAERFYLDPSAGDRLEPLASILHRVSRMRGFAVDAKEARLLGPREVAAAILFTYASARISREAADEVLRLTRLAERLDPACSYAIVLQAGALMLLDRRDEAQACYRRAAEILLEAGSGDALLRAAQAGDAKLIEKALQAGCKLTSREIGGYTPLMLAATPEAAAALLDAGASLSETSFSNETALHLAVTWNRREVAALFLEKGAKLNAKDRAGMTPLHFAVTNPEDLLKLLIEKGADVRAADFAGNTPLHFAAGGNHLENARRLIQAGADVNALNLRGSSPLAGACALDAAEVFGLLLEHGARTAPEQENELSVLHFAAMSNAVKCLAMLLDRKMAPDTPDAAKRTPLMWGIAANAKDATRLLLKRGADAMKKDAEGNTLLHVAAVNGTAEIATLLAEYKADPGAKNSLGYTPLHSAAGKENTAVVGALLDAGAAIDATSDFGFTPLHIAANLDRAGIAKLLLQRGASKDAKDMDGKTPADYARSDAMRAVFGLPPAAAPAKESGAEEPKQ